MRKTAILCVLLFLLPLAAAPSFPPPVASDIQLPVVTIPLPTPLPVSSWISLPPDVLYVIQGNSDFLVTTSPDSGLVTLIREEGPVRIRGRFVENPTKVVSRTFKSKYIVIVEASVAGKCELLVFPKTGISSLSQVQRQNLDVGGIVPVPPVPPVPPIPPGPLPDAFTAALQLAYTADASPDRVKQLAMLRALYQEAPEIVDRSSLSTTASILRAMKWAAGLTLLGDGLMPMRKLIEAELNRDIGTEDIPLTSEIRSRIKVAFAKVSRALEGVK